MFGARCGAAIVDAGVVAVAAVLSWQAFITSTYERVGPIAVQDCAALRGTVRVCEELNGMTYVSNATTSLAVEWLAWLVPIILIHVVMQSKTGFTIGKGLFGLRTVSEDGMPAGMKQTLLRTTLAVVDAAPWCFPILAIGLILDNSGHRRLGDMVAKTFVVSKSDAGRPITVPGLRPDAVPAS